jgi:hypothetical protein
VKKRVSPILSQTLPPVGVSHNFLHGLELFGGVGFDSLLSDVSSGARAASMSAAGQSANSDL